MCPSFGRMWYIRPVGWAYKVTACAQTKKSCPIINTPQEYGEEVPIMVKSPILKYKAWAGILTKIAGLTADCVFSIQDDVEVILNYMSEMGADSSPLHNLLGSFFDLVTSYDQARSTLVDKATTIEESESYLKAIEHLDLLSRERDEKFEEVSIGCKSLEKVRKKVKKLRDRRDVAKLEAESKISASEEEFHKGSNISLGTKNASNIVDMKNQVLEAILLDLSINGLPGMDAVRTGSFIKYGLMLLGPYYKLSPIRKEHPSS
ncbi:hypothetical protein FXO38_27678 [Capsicum annuum]|nr:hypothetical protein FXO38_27678 [Capsicum annuum]